MPPPAIGVIEGEKSAFVLLRKRNWSRLLAKGWMEDPTICKRCGKEMEAAAAISSTAQDDVIEKILRSRTSGTRRGFARGPCERRPVAASGVTGKDRATGGRT